MAYTSARVSSNGFITFGTTNPSATNYAPISASAGYAGAIAAWARDINTVYNVAGQTGEIRWEVVGTAPNREVVVQWSKFRPVYDVPDTNAYVFDFQVRLAEDGNVVRVVYGGTLGHIVGSTGYSGPAVSNAPQIGLRGATNADFNNRTNPATVAFTASTAGTTNAATQAFSTTTNPPGMPTSGLTYTWTPLPACSGAPTAGSITPAAPTACPGGTATLVLTGYSPLAGPVTGAAIQWQRSTDNVTFTNISGATSASYTTPALTAVTYYRAYVKCTNTGDSVFSSPVTVTIATPTPTVATLPYTQSFESWINTCATTDRPGTEWLLSPFRSDSAWRRNDQGSSAGWTSTSGSYSPVSTAGSFSARFHTYDAASAASVATATGGSMLLHVNMSAAGNKIITFDHININGTDSLFVEISTNGGSSYTQLAGYGIAANWTSRVVTTTATTASAIIRFRAKGDYGTTDIGMDNLNIVVSNCFSPTGVTVGSLTGTSATITWTAPSPAPGIGYRYEVRSSGAAGSGATGLVAVGNTAAGVTTANITGLTEITAYSVYVRSVCSAGDSSLWTSATTFITTLNCANATVLTCGSSATATIPSGNGGYSVTACGFSTPGKEALFSFTPTTTGTYTFSVLSATGGYIDYFFKAASGGCGPTGWTCIGDLNAAGNRNMTLTGGTTYYLLADAEGTGGMVHTFRINCCFTPTALNAVGTTQTSTALTWNQNGSATQWQVQYGSSSFTLGSGTQVSTTTNSLPLSNLTPGTGYSFFVRAICGPGDTSVWSGRYTFSTVCPNSTLPFAENFAAVPPTACWSLATGYLTSTPSALTTTTSNSWGVDQYLNNSANGPAARINIWTTGKRDWIISPTIDLGTTPGNYIVELNLGVVAYSSSTSVTSPVGTALGVDDTVAVVVSTDNGATWSTANALRRWTAASTPVSTNGSNRYYIPMNGYSGLIKIGFYASEGPTGVSSSTAGDNDIFIDSVRIVSCTTPTVNLGADTVLCSGASATLNAPAGATGYSWSTGASTQSITVSTAGTYSVSAYNNSLGCAGRDTIVVTTGTNPTVNLGPDTTFCSGPVFTLNAGNAGSTYLYNTGATTQSIPVTTSGQYSVRVRNAAGCFGRDTVNVTINPTPVVNLGNDTTVCGNVQSFVLNAGNNLGATFSWMGSTVTAQTLNIAPILNALNNGPIVTGTQYTGSVVVTSAAGCVNSDTIRVTVNFSPRVSDYIITGQDPTLTFTPVGDSAVTSYAWNFGDGGTATTRIATRTFNSGGVYNVRLIASNSCGSDTVQKQVQINTAGVGNVISEGAISLYPNPTAADAVLEVEGGATLRGVQVVSATGALVINEPASGTRTVIRTGSLAPGIYTLRIQLDKGVVVRKLDVVK